MNPIMMSGRMLGLFILFCLIPFMVAHSYYDGVLYAGVPILTSLLSSVLVFIASFVIIIYIVNITSPKGRDR